MFTRALRVPMLLLLFLSGKRRSASPAGGRRRRRAAQAGIGATVVAGVLIAGMHGAAAAALPSSVQLSQWENDATGEWINGNLGAQNSSYAEGEVIPFRLDLTGVKTGAYEFTVCRSFSNGNTLGYLFLDSFDESETDVEVGAPITSEMGPFTAAATGGLVTLVSVTEVSGQGACSADDRATVVQVIILGIPTEAYVLWGGHLASAADPGVGFGNGAGSYSGASLHMKLASPNKDVSLNPNGIIELADLTVQKVVDTGTASAAQWCFTIDPNPNGVTLPLCPVPGTSTVTFLALQTGSYTVTETMNVAGYTFASGSGSSCTFTGSTATASVIAGLVPQDASCIFHNASAPPTVTVDKTATPRSLPEPGGAFTYSVVVTNTSATETVTITSLTDDIYNLGTVVGNCDDLVNDILAPLGTATCTFTGNFTGNAGASETDTVTVVVTDTDGQTATASDDAVVGISGVDPTVTVLKSASPLSLPEPGGNFTFTVEVTNTSAEPVTITSLVDDKYNLARVVGDCDDLVGDSIAAGASATCSFTGAFAGNPGATQTDIVTVVVTDDDGTTATADDDAVVTVSDVAPSVTVIKTALPLSLPEPGGNFTFTVAVVNTSLTEVVTITSLKDSIYGDLAAIGSGDCDDLVGDSLAAGATRTCTFTGNFTGNAGDSETDIVTVVVTDDDGTTASDDDDATVTLTDVAPSVTVIKTALPLSLPEPGGKFTFTVVVNNTSAEAITITRLVDSVYDWTSVDGNCDDLVGDSLAAGASVTCTFTGNFTGNAGDSETDIVTVVVTDDDGSTATGHDDAVVGLSGVDPTVTVLKTALPSSLPEPGGDFNFTVVVNNTSAEAVTITSLTDSVYDLVVVDGDCDDLVGDSLAAGASATCTFTGNFAGNAGDSETDTVTVVVTDDDGITATDDDDAIVSISDVAPRVTVVKAALPLSLPEPGGTSTYTVVVTNTSAEAVTITSLTDSIYNLATVPGNCDDLVGDILPPGASVTCTFTGNFTGNAGESETDVVTVVVTDDDDTTATDEDDATVNLTDVAPTVTVVKTASPPSLPAPGGDFTYTVVITNTSAEAVTITSLTDSIYNLATVPGNCDDLVGDILAVGASVTCTFTGNFTGQDGDSETDVVTVVVTDDDRTTATQIDDATVNLGPAPLVPVPFVEVMGDREVRAPAPPAVLPAMTELPRTGSRESQRQVFLALGFVLTGVMFRLVTRRRWFHPA